MVDRLFISSGHGLRIRDFGTYGQVPCPPKTLRFWRTKQNGEDAENFCTQLDPKELYALRDFLTDFLGPDRRIRDRRA